MRVPRCFLIPLMFALVFAGTVRAADEPVFSLGAGDVGKGMISIINRTGIRLGLKFGKDKQAELAQLTASGLPKKVRIELQGKAASVLIFTQKENTRDISFPEPTLDEALAHLDALFPPAAAGQASAPVPAPAQAQPPAGPVLALTRGDVQKLTFYVMKPRIAWVEITTGGLAHATLLDLVTKNPGITKIPVTLEHQYIGDWENLPEKGVSQPIVIPMPTFEQAAAAARAGMGK